jgi:predicted site-specific integrase-resolvase
MDDDESENDYFITMQESATFSAMHPHTIRKYADAGKIKCFKTPTGQRRIHKGDLQKFCGSPRSVLEIPKRKKTVTNFIYSRVSSKKQMDDLSRQTQYIQQYNPEYATYVSITDVASGINFKRKGLQKILDACLQRTIGELVISHRDRLCRFGYELIDVLVEKSGGKIIVLDDDKHKSSEQELAEDLLSIVHIYSCKQMGKRSYTHRKLVENTDGETETNETAT